MGCAWVKRTEWAGNFSLPALEHKVRAEPPFILVTRLPWNGSSKDNYYFTEVF